MLRWILLLICTCLVEVSVNAATIQVNMYRTTTQGQGPSVGSIILTDTRYGLLIIPNLTDLPPGIHGFHVHEHPSCDHHGEDAGGHLDPKQTGNHLGPYSNKGHLGDLPALTVNDKGVANLPILAPRLKVRNLKNHALMIHAGGDNYSDIPEKLGGGGARIACGVIQN